MYLLLKVETGWLYCALLGLLADPFGRSSPSPGYFNPIPWKPIHIPPPEQPKEEACSRKPQRQHRSKQSPSAAFRLRTPARLGQFQRRWRRRLTPAFVMNSQWLTEQKPFFLEWQNDFGFRIETREFWYDFFFWMFLVDSHLLWWIYIRTYNLKYLKCLFPLCCQAHVLKCWWLEGTAKDRPGLVKCHLTRTHCSVSSCVLVLVWAEMTTEASEGVGREREGGSLGFRAVFILWSHPTVIQIHAAWGKTMFLCSDVRKPAVFSHSVCSVLSMVTVECLDSQREGGAVK